MSEKSNTTVGWLAVLTALIPLFGILYNNYVNKTEKVGDRQQQIEIETAKLNQEHEIETAKLDQEHEDVYLSTVLDQEKRERDVLDKGAYSGQAWRVSFKNDCPDAVQVAVEYVSLTGDAVVQGWYTIAKSETAETLTTNSSLLRYWAHSGDFEWNGDNAVDSYMLRNKRFRYVLDDHYDNGWYKPKDAFSKIFRRVDMASSPKGPILIPLTCAVQSAPQPQSPVAAAAPGVAGPPQPNPAQPASAVTPVPAQAPKPTGPSETHYKADHDGKLNGCRGGDLLLSGPTLTFTCPAPHEDRSFTVRADQVKTLNKNGIELLSNEKYHFHVGDMSEGEVEALFNDWLVKARNAPPPAN